MNQWMKMVFRLYIKNTLLKTLALPMSSVYGVCNRASSVVRQREATARICTFSCALGAFFFSCFIWFWARARSRRKRVRPPRSSYRNASDGLPRKPTGRTTANKIFVTRLIRRLKPHILAAHRAHYRTVLGSFPLLFPHYCVCCILQCRFLHFLAN
jgi:hypothetical protein